MNGETPSSSQEEIIGNPQESEINSADGAEKETSKPEVPLREQLFSKIEEILAEGNQEAREERTRGFIEGRVGELTKASTPSEINLLRKSAYKGFIHPESRVSRSLIVDPFRVNDDEIYSQLIESIKEFRGNPNWKDKSLREIAPQAVLMTLGKYFGNHVADQKADVKNREFYFDHIGSESEDISLKELKGKDLSVCAERSAVTQNLLAFLGYDSEMVLSDGNRLLTPHEDDTTGHAYNVISTERGHFIYDPTNSVIVREEGGDIRTIFPATYGITDEQYETLMAGGKVEVVHNDFTWNGSDYVKGPGAPRIYAGPNKRS